MKRTISRATLLSSIFSLLLLATATALTISAAIITAGNQEKRMPDDYLVWDEEAGGYTVSEDITWEEENGNLYGLQEGDVIGIYEGSAEYGT